MPGNAPAAKTIDMSDSPVAETLTSIGQTIVIKGDVQAGEHLVVEGRIEGRITVADHGLAVGKGGRIDAEVVARTITVRGHADGQLTGSEYVEVLASGRVRGRIVTSTLVIDDGAYFTGSVDPSLSQTVMAVTRHRLRGHGDEA